MRFHGRFNPVVLVIVVIRPPINCSSNVGFNVVCDEDWDDSQATNAVW